MLGESVIMLLGEFQASIIVTDNSIDSGKDLNYWRNATLKLDTTLRVVYEVEPSIHF